MTDQKDFASIALPPKFRTIDGVSIRFVENGRGDAEALLLSPWPESVFAYEPIWSRLAATTHLVGIDLPGFGRSEHRDALMTPRAMGEFVVRVADVFGLENPHIVGPDVGTSAALFAAATQPGRFRSLVIGTGGAAVPLQLGEPLREWISAPNVDAYRGIGRQIVEGVIQTLERYKVSAAAREDYIASYEGDRFADSMSYVRSYPVELPILGDVLPRIETPVLLINGRRDTAVPPVNVEYLHEHLPHSELRLLDATHFVWEDNAGEYATLVSEWWAGGYKAATR
jgi:pimeloyl-ACP methyl ester carboxylesterase